MMANFPMEQTLLAVLVCAVSAACGDDFRPYNEVDGFRLLAIVADPPQLRPGETVRLTALVVGDDAPRFSWQWCAVTSGPTTAHACAIADDEIVSPLPAPLLGTSTSATIFWPDDDASTAALCRLSALRMAPADAPRLDCGAARPEIYVRLEVESATGQRIVALQPLPLSTTDGPRNENPAITDVRVLDGDESVPLVDEMTLPMGKTLDVRLTVPADAAEPVDGERDQEILRATWFVSGGETDAERTVFIPNDDTATFDTLVQNQWTLPTEPRDVALYLVLRDDRGGTSWIARRANVEGGAQ